MEGGDLGEKQQRAEEGEVLRVAYRFQMVHWKNSRVYPIPETEADNALQNS